MANIIQAGKWMKEGKKVRRESWMPGGYILVSPVGNLLGHSNYEPKDSTYDYLITMLDTLIEEDWEIYESDTSTNREA
jgi:hypothetical protein